jgi:hypothetical protein
MNPLITATQNLADVNGAVNISPKILILLAIFILWSLIWKALALWRAAHRESKVWFVLFLIINTAGILEIIYLLTTNGQSEDKPRIINPIAPEKFTPSQNQNLS